jgi:hypothetical protein
MLRNPSPRVTSAESSVGETQRLIGIGSYKYPGAAIRPAQGRRRSRRRCAVIADANTADEVLARFSRIYVLGMSLEARSAGS